MPVEPVDFLLLNASNYPRMQIYPYAFVQLRALARRRGLTIRSIDLSMFSQDGLRKEVDELICRHRPRIVGLHLRQLDSLIIDEYIDHSDTYRPFLQTLNLADAVKETTDAPLVVGGFGFTAQARSALLKLPVDFGVRGEPESFFEDFDRLCARPKRPTTAGLIYKSGGVLVENSRIFSPPLAEAEYTPEVIADMRAFYGDAALNSDYQPSFPVELSRGCPFACSFCTEPFVKGRRPMVRDLDAVFEDVDALAREGIWHFWMVCSELNLGKPDLAIEVAERFIRRAESKGGRPLRWRAYHLPRWLSRGDLELLARSGFAGGWNDFVGFDDDVLKRSVVPYRRRHLDAYFNHTKVVKFAAPFPGEQIVGLFAGDLATTPSAILEGLKTLLDLGSKAGWDQISISKATRLFEPLHLEQIADGSAVTFGEDGKPTDLDFTSPTFAVSPSMRECFTSLTAVVMFLQYLEEVVRFCFKTQSVEWPKFLQIDHVGETLRSFGIVAPQSINLSIKNIFPRELVSSLRPRIVLHEIIGRRVSDLSALELLAELSLRFDCQADLIAAATVGAQDSQRALASLRLEAFLFCRMINLDRSSRSFFRAAVDPLIGEDR